MWTSIIAAEKGPTIGAHTDARTSQSAAKGAAKGGLRSATHLEREHAVRVHLGSLLSTHVPRSCTRQEPARPAALRTCVGAGERWYSNSRTVRKHGAPPLRCVVGRRGWERIPYVRACVSRGQTDGVPPTSESEDAASSCVMRDRARGGNRGHRDQ